MAKKGILLKEEVGFVASAPSKDKPAKGAKKNGKIQKK